MQRRYMASLELFGSNDKLTATVNATRGICRLLNGLISLKPSISQMLVWQPSSVNVAIFECITQGWGGTPYGGLYGEALPERGIFFRLFVYKR